MFWPKSSKIAEKREPEQIPIYASDDRLTRAKNIVRIMGMRGAVGNFVLEVENVLRKYEELDALAAEEQL